MTIRLFRAFAVLAVTISPLAAGAGRAQTGAALPQPAFVPAPSFAFAPTPAPATGGGQVVVIIITSGQPTGVPASGFSTPGFVPVGASPVGAAPAGVSPVGGALTPVGALPPLGTAAHADDLNKKVIQLEARVRSLEATLSTLDKKLDHQNEQLANISKMLQQKLPPPGK